MTGLSTDRRTLVVLLGPALLVYATVVLLPMVVSLAYALVEGNPVSGFAFVGPDNLQRLAADEALRSSTLFTLRYAVVLTLAQVGLGYALALLYVFVLRRASAVVRTVLFLPVALPTVAVALLFRSAFEIAPVTGPVNQALNAVGISSVDWFGAPAPAFAVLVLMDLWRSVGFYAVLLYAGLLDVPDEVLEAARLDGASGIRLVRYVVLPLSLPVLVAALVFSANGTLKVFDSVLALTRGGPGDDTTSLGLAMFESAFGFGEYGYGASIAVWLTLLCLAVTAALVRADRRTRTGGGA